MSQSITTTLSVVAEPISGSAFPNAISTFEYAPTTPKTVAAAGVISQTVTSATNLSIMPAGVTSATYVYLHVYGGSLNIKITTSQGTAQVVPCDEVFFLASTTVPVTAITVSGTAQLEGLIAGS